MHYQVNLIKDANAPDPLRLLTHLKNHTIPDLASAGITTFGVFQGLFGLASNELYLVTSSASAAPDIVPHLGGYACLATTNLVPTVRPVTHTPRTKNGIYVFRWFSVLNKDVDEIAALSVAAWRTFESGFDTEVQALFAEPDQTSPNGTMLLVTWYRDLNVWQASRQPSPEAQENFSRRHQLTLEARPIATRLVSAGMAPVVPGGTNRFS